MTLTRGRSRNMFASMVDEDRICLRVVGIYYGCYKSSWNIDSLVCGTCLLYIRFGIECIWDYCLCDTKRRHSVFYSVNRKDKDIHYFTPVNLEHGNNFLYTLKCTRCQAGIVGQISNDRMSIVHCMDAITQKEIDRWYIVLTTSNGYNIISMATTLYIVNDNIKEVERYSFIFIQMRLLLSLMETV